MPPTPRTALLAMTPTQLQQSSAGIARSREAVVSASVVSDDEPEDPERELRAITLVELLSTGTSERKVLQHLVRAYAITPVQARAEYDDALARLRRQLDDEGAIDAVHAGALARVHLLERRMREIALTPIEDRILERYGPDPDEPLNGALYRSLSPAEHAACVSARVQAGKAMLQANELLLKVVGRRSARWAEKPQNVIIATSNGLSPEDKKLLEDLGMKL